MRGGLAPTEIGDYGGTLEFRCWHACWTVKGIDALEDARTLVARGGRGKSGRAFALDDQKVAAAAKLDARRVAVGDLRPLELRSDPEREHVRSQDEAVESMLDSWFERSEDPFGHASFSIVTSVASTTAFTSSPSSMPSPSTELLVMTAVASCPASVSTTTPAFGSRAVSRKCSTTHFFRPEQIGT
ncbi:hypothetical protein [Halorussus salinisoli]|nr:hypothetical protein [Halorussus salinisoli]